MNMELVFHIMELLRGIEGVADGKGERPHRRAIH